MATEIKRTILSLAKYILLITFTHLYIVICTIVYYKLEGFDQTKHPAKQVETFLLTTNVDIKTNPSEYLMKYRENVEQEKYWSIRHAFNSIPRTYVFVLATHTTLGNRHMMLQTWQSHLFYIFTVPIGVILYYIMIHIISKLHISNMKVAVMLVFRQEDRSLSDKQREFFESLKLTIATLLTTLIFILLLGMTSLIDGNSYVEEIYYIIDTLFTISSSNKFVSIPENHDDINAFLSTLIYFTCLLLVYQNLYTVSILFKTYDIKDMILMCRGGEHTYKSVNTDEEVSKSTEDDGDDEHSIWDKYESQSIKQFIGSQKK